MRKDLAKLKSHGMEVLRVFPLWTDFQPVKVLYEAQMHAREYRMADDRLPDNAFFLDREQLLHFHSLCQLAEEQNLKLIVGLVTGWMSGRLFVPPALDGTNLFTDFRALWLTQLYVHGLVSELREEAAILAWDLGNECNCMGEATREEAAHWTTMITDAIRVCDPNRPILSGMHSLTCCGSWTIAAQGMWTDILTTHPYPCFVPHASLERNDSLRALLHATAETVLYADISGMLCPPGGEDLPASLRNGKLCDGGERLPLPDGIHIRGCDPSYHKRPRSFNRIHRFNRVGSRRRRRIPT